MRDHESREDLYSAVLLISLYNSGTHETLQLELQGGRMPCQLSTTDYQSVLADYAFKFSIERDGNKFYACGEKLRTWISDPFNTDYVPAPTTTTKLYLSGMRNFKCRTILANNVPMIGPLQS